MIKFENSLLNKFKISNIYKDEYIKIYPIYHEEFKYFRNTILYLSSRLNKFFENDLNLKKFISFYGRFIKISNSLPITLSDCVNLTENNSDINLKKISKNIKIAYPNYEKEFDYVINKFNEFKTNMTNLFLNNDLNLPFDQNNQILYESRYLLNLKKNFIKNKNYFLDPDFKKIKSITLLNPTLDLLKEIAYLDVCDYLNVLKFSWIIRDYSNLSFFISNKELEIKKLNLSYVDVPKPKINTLNEFKGEIFDEDIEFSTDLNEVYEKLESKNIEDSKIEDINLKNENDLEKIKATLFQLSNGKVALLRNDQNDKSQDVIEKTPLGRILIKSKKVDLIQPGEFILFQGERAKASMLEKETARDINNAHKLYADRKDWKFRLKQEINRLGLEKVISKLKEYGGRKTIKVNNIKYWLNPRSLRTDDRKTFFAIMKLCGLFNKAEEIWLNMETLEKAHLKAGKEIRKKIEDEVTRDTSLLFEKGFQEYFLDEKESGSIEVYKVIEKGKSIKVKLSITDKALMPDDL
tara:strand:+ start:923 stop:2488 length:1566 start_codon:yes stop_codon:yes gene_type:complete